MEYHYGCDECGEPLTTIRWVATWNGKIYIKSYRCSKHVPKLKRN